MESNISLQRTIKILETMNYVLLLVQTKLDDKAQVKMSLKSSLSKLVRLLKNQLMILKNRQVKSPCQIFSNLNQIVMKNVMKVWKQACYALIKYLNLNLLLQVKKFLIHNIGHKTKKTQIIRKNLNTKMTWQTISSKRNTLSTLISSKIFF